MSENKRGKQKNARLLSEEYARLLSDSNAGQFNNDVIIRQLLTHTIPARLFAGKKSALI